MPSVFSSEKLALDEKNDIIPLDEACRGINGRLVSFIRAHRIENCRKREILDPDLYEERI